MSFYLCGSVVNFRFTISVEAWIGARKTSSTSYTGIPTWGSGFQPQDFTSNNSTMLQMTFGFDLRPPVHCLTNAVATSNNCTVFPIFMNETVTEVFVALFFLCISTKELFR